MQVSSARAACCREPRQAQQRLRAASRLWHLPQTVPQSLGEPAENAKNVGRNCIRRAVGIAVCMGYMLSVGKVFSCHLSAALEIGSPHRGPAARPACGRLRRDTPHCDDGVTMLRGIVIKMWMASRWPGTSSCAHNIHVK